MAEHARRPNRLEVDASIAEAVTRREGDWVTLGGIVSAVTIGTTIHTRMAVLTLADFNASIEVIVLGDHHSEIDDVLLVAGRLQRRGRRMVLRAQVVERFELEL